MEERYRITWDEYDLWNGRIIERKVSSKWYYIEELELAFSRHENKSNLKIIKQEKYEE